MWRAGRNARNLRALHNHRLLPRLLPLSNFSRQRRHFRATKTSAPEEGWTQLGCGAFSMNYPFTEATRLASLQHPEKPDGNRHQIRAGSPKRKLMDAKTFDKSKLPSRHVTEGPSRAPHRSYYYAMGLDEEDIKRPFVGVVSCWNEAAPCNISLMRQAQSAKAGVKEGGGTPREFCTITVTDGIAMGHQGMKSIARVARGHRRFDRTDDARPQLRCARRRRGLRQESARHDDGDAAPQRAERVHVRRLDPAGKIQGP